uniref:MFS domain-containing protein n=1 Tax=Steinernema glaseri TaxID=37863 RepID=A0A1I7YIG4_9BILA
MGALRLWTPVVAVLLENGSSKFGRKTLMVSTQTFVFVCFTAMFFVDLANNREVFHVAGTVLALAAFVFVCFTAMFFVDLANNREVFHVAGTVLALAGYVVESSLVWIAYKLYTTELFPTVVRTIALNTFSTTSLLGSVLSPQLIYLKKYWHPLPYCGAALTAALAALMAVMILPETKFVALPDTIHEAKAKELSQATKNKLLHVESKKKESEQPLI